MDIAAHGLFTLLLHIFGFATLVLLLTCLLLGQTPPILRARLLSRVEGPLGQTAALVLFSSLYCVLAVLALTFPGYIDPDEPFVIASAAFLTHHQSVYAWATAYGPYCYLLYGFIIRLFHLSIPVLKCTVFVANVILIGLLYAVFRRRLPRLNAALTTSLVLSSLALKQSYPLQIRGDVLIFIAVTLSLLVSLGKRTATSFVLLVLTITLAIGIKITAILYLLYPLARVWKRFGTDFIAGSLAVAAILSLSPFLFLHSLSLESYIFWLAHMSGQLRSEKELAGNLFTSLVFLAPCVLVFRALLARNRERAMSYLKSNRIPLTMLMLSLCVLDGLAGKFGGGRHHISPFAPLFAFVAADLYAVMQEHPASRLHPTPLTWVFSWGCVGLLLLLAEGSELQDMWSLTRQERVQAQALAADVDMILRQYPPRDVELGDGYGELNLTSQYSPMYAGPQLISAGANYHFEPNAQADMELMRVPMPQTEMAALEQCRRPVYLIPRGEQPFSTLSIYSAMYPKLYPKHQLFPPAFQQTFLHMYTHTATSQFFDVYTCRPKPKVATDLRAGASPTYLSAAK